MVMMEEDPFPDMKIDSTEFLDTLTGRSKCPKCERSRKYYCYTCCVPLTEIKDKVPTVKLPIKVDIIKHPCEVDGKSTAVHAKVIAHDDVTIYTYPCIPDYDKEDKVLLVFPGKDAVTLKQLAELWLPACTKDKTDHTTHREPAFLDRQQSDKVELTISDAAESSRVQEPSVPINSVILVEPAVVDESSADSKGEASVLDGTITSEPERRSVKREADSGDSALVCPPTKKQVLDDKCGMTPTEAELNVDCMKQRQDCDTCVQSGITLINSDKKHPTVSDTVPSEDSLQNADCGFAAATAVSNGNSADADAKCANAGRLTASSNSDCSSTSAECSNSQEVSPTFRLAPGCPVQRVVFIDSTWNQTRNICMDERLKGLRHVELQLQKTKFWRHQKDIPDTYLSTIEAIYYFLHDFHENFVQTPYSGEYDNLLFFFTFMYRKICGLYKGGSELKAYIQRKEGKQGEKTAQGK